MKVQFVIFTPLDPLNKITLITIIITAQNVNFNI